MDSKVKHVRNVIITSANSESSVSLCHTCVLALTQDLTFPACGLSHQPIAMISVLCYFDQDNIYFS